MRRMTIPEIQRVSMGILQHIDVFCKKHNIRYWLDSGTLIGAARDKSLIPWDDDIDISMPRSDFERFVEQYVDTRKYKLYDSSRGNSYLTYARMCEMEDTYFCQNSVWTDELPGVGLDIFPIDGAPSDVHAFDRHLKELVKIRNRIWFLRWVHTPIALLEIRKDVSGFVKDLVHFLGQRMFGRFFLRQLVHLLKKDRKIRKSYSYEGNDHCFIMVTTHDRRMYWDKLWFRSSIDVEIDGKMFPAPIDLDLRLRAEYGDYMTPPPLENRQNHVSIQSMWWK